jgi:methylenetetrahydrofolate dehydrogenase (NADP+)/methenyltetrahydrofolate cyclohydrolase
VTLIDGRAIAAAINAETVAEVERLAAARVKPLLAAVYATDDEATAWYLRSLGAAAERTGVELRALPLPPDDGERVLALLDELSDGEVAHGILCLTPLPAGLTLARAGERITPAKDVDGASPLGLGRLAAGLRAFAPATAQAVIEVLDAHGSDLSGAELVVVGRSTVVGKPLALLALARDATVTVCHSRTRDLASVTRRADVLVAAAGRAGLIGAAHVKPGAVVIDVGTNPGPDGGLVGDVDAAAVEPLASALTPVPGGVGPVTSAVLMRNVVRAAAPLAES